MDEKQTKDAIGESLGLSVVEKIEDENTEIIVSDELEDDFSSARHNIHDMINTAKDAISNLSQIANLSQQPRAYEVLAKLIETSVKANKDLLDIQEKIKQIKNIETKTSISDNSKTINNNLFVGSTSDLQKLLKEIKNEQ